MVKPGGKSEAIVESIDVYLTLCELTGIPLPDGIDGESLMKNLLDPSMKGGSAISYFGDNETIRTDRYRLTRHGENKFELYDHTGIDGETTNLADKKPELIDEINGIMRELMK